MLLITEIVINAKEQKEKTKYALNKNRTGLLNIFFLVQPRSEYIYIYIYICICIHIKF